jgi:hypothetical protein
MNKEYNLIPIIVIWALVIILNIWTSRAMLSRRLDKIENNQKEIIEILRNGDV